MKPAPPVTRIFCELGIMILPSSQYIISNLTSDLVNIASQILQKPRESRFQNSSLIAWGSVQQINVTSDDFSFRRGRQRLRMQHGKIPAELLRNIVFKYLGAEREEVALGPSTGYDGAVVNIGDQSIIISADPISGAKKKIGWLALNINANDIATFGVKPAFFVPCILLPEKADDRTLKTMCSEMDQAAKALRIAIIGGHSEVTPGLSSPIIAGCAIGTTKKGNYVTAGGAKPRDKLILTKTAGIEGTAILASERREMLENVLPCSLLTKAERFYDRISVVREAITAYSTGGVNAMHDPTEGGVNGGIHEMADASNLGVEIEKEKIKIATETHEICNLFKIDPLQLIGSGALLIASKPRFTKKILEKLNKTQIEAQVIGEFTDSPETRLLVQNDGAETNLVRPEQDHLWQALQERQID